MWDGLWIKQKRGFTPFPDPRLCNGIVHAIAEDTNGAIWVADDDKIFRIQNGKAVSASAAVPQAALDRVTALCPDKTGGMWASVTLGVMHIISSSSNEPASRWKRKFYPFGSLNKQSYGAHVMIPASGGGIWLGMTEGIILLKNEMMRSWNSNNGLGTVPIIALREDAAGGLWMGSWGEGLYRLKNGKIAHITERDGLPANCVQQIIDDHAGNYWIGSSKGVSRVVISDLNRLADGKISTIRSFPVLPSDGATGGMTLGGIQSTGFLDTDGTMWFTTISGLEHIRVPKTSGFVLPIKIEDVSINGKEYPWSLPVSAPPGDGRLNITFTAIDFTSAKKIHFQYRLIGFDPDWVESDSGRIAHYTNLPPGHYQFVVRAQVEDGAWNVLSTPFNIELQPHIYQTWQFKFVFALIVLAAIILAVRFRLMGLRQRARELEARVQRRTEDLRNAMESLGESRAEVVEQNSQLKNIQAELEAQNQELLDSQMVLAHQQHELELQNDEMRHINAQLIELKKQLEFNNEELESANDRLAALATEDGLTGLKNHRAFQDKLEHVLFEHRDSNSPLSLILLDVDFFKQYNDTFGHPAGDEILKTFSRTLQECGRNGDFVARYGGEEFAIILPYTDKKDAIIAAERYRTTLHSHTWPLRVMTASFGISTTSSLVLCPADLIAQADAALYSAKESGRDRCHHHGDTLVVDAAA